jgi:hypothetical protein
MTVASDQYFLPRYNVSPLINISYRFTKSVVSDQYLLAPYNVCSLW